ncbi:MAG: YciI family protein [Acidobacteria bacterium]|nr:YciI family protein [Acidobacteriota bacterium]MCG3193927.1 hypothetical protein [Thermoanaerobaculia bacterium]
MKYLLMIYDEESRWQQLSEAEREATLGEYFQLSRDLAAAGKLRGGEELEPVSSASTLRVRGGRTLVSDGPFAEAREQLGGFYLVDAVDLDDAIAVAARIPAARTGAVEVRPVVTHEMPAGPE